MDKFEEIQELDELSFYYPDNGGETQFLEDMKPILPNGEILESKENVDLHSLSKEDIIDLIRVGEIKVEIKVK